MDQQAIKSYTHKRMAAWKTKTLCLAEQWYIRAMTANLQAPIIINPLKRIAKQVILTDERFPLRFPVFGHLNSESRAQERRRSC